LKKSTQKNDIVSNIFVVFIIFFCRFSFSQEHSQLSIDSLIKLESSTLYNGYEENFKSNPNTSRIFAHAYLKRAKIEDVDYKMAYGYCAIASLVSENFEMKIKYLDSAIVITKKTENLYFPILAYTMKGVALEEKGYFEESLSSFIKGYESSKKKKNEDYKWINNHNIALLKIKLGNFEEAEQIMQEYLIYEKEKNMSISDSIRYLTTMSTLVSVYTKQNLIKKAIDLNNQGLTLSSIYHPNQILFENNKGILKYFNKEYRESIKYLEKTLPYLSDPDNFVFFDLTKLIETYFYLGKSYFNISQNEKGLKYYKKVDSIVQSSNYLTPEIIPAFYEIIEYYKSEEDKKNQLLYINKLLYHDSILDKKSKNLSDRIIKDFDVPNLMSDKEKLIKELKIKNNTSSIFVILLVFVAISFLLLVFYNFKKRKKYEIRYNSLMNQSNDNKSKELNIRDNREEKSQLDISEEVQNKILDQLHKFETNKGFVDVNLTSISLAKKFSTNPKYLTKIIKYYKGKKFSLYINDLRIDDIIKRIKNEKVLRNYTIKALAKEAGFNSQDVFSKYFHEKTGLYPSYFLKKIQNNVKQ